MRPNEWGVPYVLGRGTSAEVLLRTIRRDRHRRQPGGDRRDRAQRRDRAVPDGVLGRCGRPGAAAVAIPRPHRVFRPVPAGAVPSGDDLRDARRPRRARAARPARRALVHPGPDGAARRRQGRVRLGPPGGARLCGGLAGHRRRRGRQRGRGRRGLLLARPQHRRRAGPAGRWLRRTRPPYRRCSATRTSSASPTSTGIPTSTSSSPTPRSAASPFSVTGCTDDDAPVGPGGRRVPFLALPPFQDVWGSDAPAATDVVVRGGEAIVRKRNTCFTPLIV
jgi:hypothetical protein